MRERKQRKPTKAEVYYQNAMDSTSDLDFEQNRRLLKKQSILDTILYPFLTIFFLLVGIILYFFTEDLLGNIEFIHLLITLIFIVIGIKYLIQSFMKIIKDWTYVNRLHKEKNNKIKIDQQNSISSQVDKIVVRSSSYNQKPEIVE